MELIAADCCDKEFRYSFSLEHIGGKNTIFFLQYSTIKKIFLKKFHQDKTYC